MKKIIFLSLCLLFSNSYADTIQVRYTSTHDFITPSQDPLNFCYPPAGQDFSNYFSHTKCYYRFNTDCSDAQIVSFDLSNNPSQTQNSRFFNLCNTKNSTLNLGPEIIFWIDPNTPATTPNTGPTIDACVLLANNSATQKSGTSLSVFFDKNTAPDVTKAISGCEPNQIAIYDLQTPVSQNPPTYQVSCLPVTNPNPPGTVSNAIFPDPRFSNAPRFSGLMSGHYKTCPTNSGIKKMKGE